MALIQRSDLIEKIRRAFNLYEHGVGTTLSPELVPVVLVEDLTSATIGDGYPRRAVGHAEAGASVGVYSEAFLINPTGSTVDLVVDELWLRRTTNGQARVRMGPNANLNNLLGTQTRRWNVDMRVQDRPNATVDSRNQPATVTATRDWLFTLTANEWLVFPAQLTLPPGTWAQVVPDTNNTAIYTTWYWTERMRR